MLVAQFDSDVGGDKYNELEKGLFWGEFLNGVCQKGCVLVVNLKNSQ